MDGWLPFHCFRNVGSGGMCRSRLGSTPVKSQRTSLVRPSRLWIRYERRGRSVGRASFPSLLGVTANGVYPFPVTTATFLHVLIRVDCDG